MQVPDDLRYTSDHEWVRSEGDEVTVGITEFAESALGDIVFVQLPKVGSVVEAGETVAELESTKSVSEVYAPAGGRVVAVNEELSESPELINSEPYGDGWLFKLAGADLQGLLDAGAYRDLIREA
jgi:glycine cleavage system H protein